MWLHAHVCMYAARYERERPPAASTHLKRPVLSVQHGFLYLGSNAFGSTCQMSGEAATMLAWSGEGLKLAQYSATL